MKKVGVIGGLSALSSEIFYSEFIRQAQQREPVEYPAIMINSVSVKAFLPHLQDSVQLLDLLTAEIAKIQDHVDVIAIPCNTVHYLIDQLRAFSKVPILAIQEETVEAIEKTPVKKVGILGTKTTIGKDIYQQELDKINVDYEVMELTAQETLNTLLFGKVIYGKGYQEMREFVDQSIRYFESKGCDSVLLACTELPLFAPYGKTDIPLFSTLKILVESSFQFALGEKTIASWATPQS